MENPLVLMEFSQAIALDGTGVDFLVKLTLMSRNACSNKNGRFYQILSKQVNVHGFDHFGEF